MFTANIIIVMLMALELSQGNYKFIFVKAHSALINKPKTLMFNHA